MYLLPAPLALRETNAGDQDFLEALYATSRDDLLIPAADPATLKALLKMQQQVQQAGLRNQFPFASHLILERNGDAIGRIVIDTTLTDLRLVDIAILPHARRRGAASAVLRALQTRARQQGLGMSLAVSKANHAARNLYLAMDFRMVTQDDLFEQMIWQETQA